MKKYDDLRIWCLYVHINRQNNKKYVGITSSKNPNYRWRNGYGYKNNKHFYNAIQKYGWDNFEHKVLYNNLLYSEVSFKEKVAIKFYDSIKNGYNKAVGGGVNYGFKLSKERIEKMAELHRGVPMPESTKQAVIKANLGRKLTDEHKEKISKAHKGKYKYNPRNIRKDLKKVIKYDLEGNFIKEYYSANEAKFEENIDGTHVADCCKGKLHTYKGFVWRYKGDPFDKYVTTIEKRVLQFDLNMNFIREWKSRKEISKTLGYNYSTLGNPLKGKQKVYKGCIWKYKDEFEVNENSDTNNKM